MLFERTTEENINFWMPHIDWLEKQFDEFISSDFDKRQSVGKKGGRPYKHSPRELAEIGIKYFRATLEAGMFPTISGLCRRLDMSRRGLLNLQKGRTGGKGTIREEYVRVIEDLKGFVEETYESQLHTAKCPYFFIFILKRFGWKG
jgi:hypothetical protein